MATITIEYDARNVGMKKLIDAVLALGAKQKDTKRDKEREATIRAIKEIREGKGIRCRTFSEYRKSVENL